MGGMEVEVGSLNWLGDRGGIELVVGVLIRWPDRKGMEFVVGVLIWWSDRRSRGKFDSHGELKQKEPRGSKKKWIRCGKGMKRLKNKEDRLSGTNSEWIIEKITCRNKCLTSD